jgi:hypothetical protein
MTKKRKCPPSYHKKELIGNVTHPVDSIVDFMVPLGTKWTIQNSLLVLGCFKDCKETIEIEYIGFHKRQLIFVIASKKTAWFICDHERFVRILNMRIKEVPMNKDLKNDIIKHRLITICVLKYNITPDLANIIFKFLGFKLLGYRPLTNI